VFHSQKSGVYELWVVLFHSRKSGVYELWVVCSEYIIGFSGDAFQSYSTRMQVEEAYQAFLKYIAERGEHVSNN
jgi:viroplasmin and RNaseH domain-containing protein